MNEEMVDDSAEMIRKEMEETKLQLAAKLQSLEKQVVEKVQSTEDTVKATVGAVQETVESVTDVVQSAAQSVSQVLDFQTHIKRHPLLVFGGAVLAGFLMAEFFSSSRRKTSLPRLAPPTIPPSGSSIPGVPPTAVNSAVAAPFTPAIYQPDSAPSHWNQLKDAAVGSLIAIVPEMTSRYAPRIIDHLVKQWEAGQANPENTPTENSDVGEAAASSETGHRLRIAPSERAAAEISARK